MPGNPQNIFETFMKTSGGFGGDDDDGLGDFFSGGGGSPLGGGRGPFHSSRFGSRMNGSASRKPAAEATVVEKPIAVTLEE